MTTRPPFGSASRAFGQTSDPAGIIGSSKDQIKIAAYRGKKIIKIVSDTAGQLTDDFHFLYLAQRCLGDLPPINLCSNRGCGAIGSNAPTKGDDGEKHQA